MSWSSAELGWSVAGIAKLACRYRFQDLNVQVVLIAGLNSYGNKLGHLVASA
jgi:hypothetical protein